MNGIWITRTSDKIKFTSSSARKLLLTRFFKAFQHKKLLRVWKQWKCINIAAITCRQRYEGIPSLPVRTNRRCWQVPVASNSKAETCSCSSKKIPKNRIKMEWSEECTCCNTDRAPCIPIKTKVQLSGADGFANSPLRPLVSPIVAVRNLLIHNKTSTLNCQP